MTSNIHSPLGELLVSLGLEFGPRRLESMRLETRGDSPEVGHFRFPYSPWLTRGEVSKVMWTKRTILLFLSIL